MNKTIEVPAQLKQYVSIFAISFVFLLGGVWLMGLDFGDIRPYKNPYIRWISGLLSVLLGLAGLLVSLYFYFRYPIILMMDKSGFSYPQKNIEIDWNQVKGFESDHVKNFIVETKMIHVQLKEKVRNLNRADLTINMPLASKEDFETAVETFRNYTSIN